MKTRGNLNLNYKDLIKNGAFVIIIMTLLSVFIQLFAQSFPIELKSIFHSEATKIKPEKGAVDLQTTLRKISKERTPGVVHVGAVIELDPYVAEYYGLPVENTVTGSGFIISENGYVITNQHVITGAKEVIITLWNGEEYYAGIVGADEKTDVALLKMQTGGDDIPTLPLADSDDIRVGDVVIAIGNPWGLSGSMTMGIISATGRTDRTIEETAILKNYIQSDVAINQGNSGGPLLNLKGEVIAVNSALITSGGGWDGVSFSIPINVVKRIIENIADDGIVQRGYLGVTFKALDKDLAEYYDLDMNEGAIVVEIIEESPADKGGIEPGDVILEYNGEKIVSLDQLVNLVLATPIGEKVPVIVLRDGKEKKVYITIEERPEDLGLDDKVEVSNFGTTLWLGMELGNYEAFADNIVYDGDGLVVVDISESSHAYQKGIMPGDIIVSINDKDITDILQLEEYQDTEGQLFKLKVYRNGRFDIIAVRG